MNNKNYIK